MKLVLLLFSFIISPLYTFANTPMQICSNVISVGHTTHVIDEYRRRCEDDSLSLNAVERILACNRLRDTESENQRRLDQCLSNVATGIECQESGGQWISASISEPWLGVCQRNCPANTTIEQLMPENRSICRCNSDPSITVGFTDTEASACGGDNRLADCGEEPPPVLVAEYETWRVCVASNLQIEIDQLRAENESKALDQSGSQAVAERDQKVRDAVAALQASCDQAKASAQSVNCSSLDVDTSDPDFDGLGSAEACKSMRDRAISDTERSVSQVSSCGDVASQVKAACNVSSGGSISPVTVTSPAVSVADNPNGIAADASQITGSVEAGEVPIDAGTGSIDISWVDDFLARFESNVSNAATQRNEQVESIRKQAEECIAAFEQDPDSNEAKEGLGGLAQTAAQAFGAIDGLGGGDSSGPSELSGSSNKTGAASTPGFSGGSSGSSSGNYDDYAGGPAGFNGGGGVPESLSPSRIGGRAGASGLTPSGQALGALNGGAIGAAGRAAQIPGGGSKNNKNAAQPRRQKRSFASTKDRNALLGYKKTEKDGQTLTYNPKDVEKYGKEKLLAEAKKAAKKFGKDTPLLLENGKFVRDYLEMKNRLTWQRHNMKRASRLSGIYNSSREQASKAFHPCADFGECSTESRYNIFKLHHYRAISHIKEE